MENSSWTVQGTVTCSPGFQCRQDGGRDGKIAVVLKVKREEGEGSSVDERYMDGEDRMRGSEALDGARFGRRGVGSGG